MCCEAVQVLPAQQVPRYAMSIWYLDTQEALDDYKEDQDQPEQTEHSKQERMNTVMQHLGL